MQTWNNFHCENTDLQFSQCVCIYLIHFKVLSLKYLQVLDEGLWVINSKTWLATLSGGKKKKRKGREGRREGGKKGGRQTNCWKEWAAQRTDKGLNKQASQKIAPEDRHSGAAAIGTNCPQPSSVPSHLAQESREDSAFWLKISPRWHAVLGKKIVIRRKEEWMQDRGNTGLQQHFS